MSEPSSQHHRTDVPDSRLQRRSAVGDWLYEATTQLPAAAVGAALGAIGGAAVDKLRGPRPPEDDHAHDD